ncbi:MAG: ribonuclease P protein component [Devosia sp. 67-54]|uniref:ribonuclease P protein component n=1 Tax=unclassified Devosia TaxID=196773 RepID=UPI00095E5BB9|nr:MULTISPECIES: ribonuclease P protein component [unclassified Devosia]OJX15542.1 MAG: ribonuclease P protein component [Devosia sp. 67-54]
MTAAPQSNGSLRRLRKRAQFLNAAKGRRAGRSAFSLQAATVAAADAGLGFTVTKKVGNAPERNRIKRRLRAAARACSPQFRPQHDYVLVGRREALGEPFAKVVADLSSAIAKVHAQPRDTRI